VIGEIGTSNSIRPTSARISSPPRWRSASTGRIQVHTTLGKEGLIAATC